MTIPNIVAWNICGFNSPYKVLSCKQLIQLHNLDLLFILEAKISQNNSSNNWFHASHKIFPNEAACDNFLFSNPGRISVKWNAHTVHFSPLTMTSQCIHDIVSIKNNLICAITAIYASNSQTKRLSLWHSIQAIAESTSLPWALIGDFNCCRSIHEKVGGMALSNSQLGDFSNMIFNNGLLDLSSIGHFFTWHNQQLHNPIHIKLDRILVNDQWLVSFPKSFYKVDEPYCLDHSPLILLNNMDNRKGHRFLFKNYCTNLPDFWNCLIEVFSKPNESSPLSAFIFKLKTLENSMKHKS